jgi:hypothetical protein
MGRLYLLAYGVSPIGLSVTRALQFSWRGRSAITGVPSGFGRIAADMLLT